jgi:hypothetical protein
MAGRCIPSSIGEVRKQEFTRTRRDRFVGWGSRGDEKLQAFSPRNCPLCPEAGTVLITDAGNPAEDPSRFVNSRVTEAAAEVLFAIAIPL